MLIYIFLIQIELFFLSSFFPVKKRVYCIQSTVYRKQCTEHSVQSKVYTASIQSTVYRAQCTEHSVQYSVQSTEHRAQCTQYTEHSVQSTVYRAQCTEHSVQNTVYRAKCTEHSVQSKVYKAKCTEHIVQSKVYRVHCTEYLYRVKCNITNVWFSISNSPVNNILIDDRYIVYVQNNCYAWYLLKTA